MPPATFGDVLLGGLAPDGGLVVPATFPSFGAEELASLRGARYERVALAVAVRFVDDIPGPDLAGLVTAAYDRSRFDHPDVVSLREVEAGVFLGGLSHGPTLAFKDLALQLVGQLFEYELERRGDRLTVLGATSGDTGSSAEHAMIGKARVTVFMLSPLGRTSPFQAAQMYSLDEPNIHNLAVRGVFDDCQDLVKAVNADAGFKATYGIGAVNSINWARIMAQAAYYVYLYLGAAGEVGDLVDVAVPTGNFGNVYAGFIARRMGVPIRRLIVATNENDVLDEFFRTGRYRVRPAEDIAATSSPSMDISKASNFERYVHALLGDDAARTKALFTDLGPERSIDLAGDPAFSRIAATGFVSGRSTHADRIATIRRLHEEHGVMVDPHTADGVKVGLEHHDPAVPLVCLETAQPVKFAATIAEALGSPPPPPPRFADLLDRPQHYDVIDADIAQVKAAIAASVAPAGRP
jgi:threonine synthase